jgi:integrase
MEDVIIKCRVQHSTKETGRDKTLREEMREKVFAGVAENPLLKPKILVFTFTGLRPQELLALEWRHVNFVRKTLSVKQAVNRVYEFDDSGNKVSGGEAVGDTKTPGSVRDIRIPDIVFDVLREWQNYCKENDINSIYVFPNSKTGERLTYSGLRCSLVRFVKKHNLEAEKITLYTFRHTFATMSMEEGIHARIVADMMGHRKASLVYDIYSHVTNDSVHEKAAQVMDGVSKRYSL